MQEQTKQKIKDLGLEGLENLSEVGIETVFAIIEVVITDSENKIDDMFLPVLPLIKTKVLEVVDNIHKEQAEQV